MSDHDGFKPKNRDDMDPVEVNYLHSEIQKDIAEGKGAKHFEDVLDELHSKQAQPTHALDPIEQERVRREIEALRLQLKRDVTVILLRGQPKMRVLSCLVDINKDDGEWHGLKMRVKDEESREFDISITFDESIRKGEIDPAQIYGWMVDTLVARAHQARQYHDRRVKAVTS